MVMLWAACTTAFFGFFRLGEITAPSAALFDPTTNLTQADIAIGQGAGVGETKEWSLAVST
jgi:hypothetical protein